MEPPRPRLQPSCLPYIGSAVEDPFGGDDNIYTALGEKPAPEKLLAELVSNYAFIERVKA